MTAHSAAMRARTTYSILIADEQPLILRTLGRAMDGEGYEVLLASTGEEALASLIAHKPDLALISVVLPDTSGIDVLREAKTALPSTLFIMMSAQHSVDIAVRAMKLGAYDYILKPFQTADILHTVERAAETLALRVRVQDTVDTAKGRYDFGRVVTQSPAMLEILEMARRAAESDHTTVLIQGE